MADILNYMKLSEVRANIGDASKSIQFLHEPKKLNIPTFDGSGQGVHANVIRVRDKFAGYKYWMGFTPYPNGQPENEKISILASNDGINWEVPAGLTNPIVAEFSPDPYLVYDEKTGTLYVYYIKGGDAEGNKIRRKSSTNGITWSAEEITNIYHVSPSVVKENDIWHLYSPETSPTILHYVSNDGLNWTLENDCFTNLQYNIWHNSVYSDVSGLHFISAVRTKNQANNRTILAYGFSPDGESIVYEPLMIPSESGFYSRQIYLSCIVPIENQLYRIYISGASEDGSWGIGYVDVHLSSNAFKKREKSVKEVRYFKNVTIPAGGSLLGKYLRVAESDYTKFSISINARQNHSYEVKEATYLSASRNSLSSKALAKIIDGSTAFYQDTQKREFIAPKYLWGIFNNSTSEQTYDMTLTLFNS